MHWFRVENVFFACSAFQASLIIKPLHPFYCPGLNSTYGRRRPAWYSRGKMDQKIPRNINITVLCRKTIFLYFIIYPACPLFAQIKDICILYIWNMYILFLYCWFLIKPLKKCYWYLCIALYAHICAKWQNLKNTNYTNYQKVSQFTCIHLTKTNKMAPIQWRKRIWIFYELTQPLSMSILINY